ncbi:DinB family protein [Leptospira sp. 96542]|nr:DinB family protein [Leptospira sp. 96542]
MNNFFIQTNQFHLWATKRLFKTLNDVSLEDYKKNCGLFFLSIHGTLNHLLVAERIWFGRFSGSAYNAKSLAEEVEPDRKKLEQLIYEIFERWEIFLKEVPKERWNEIFEYKTMRGFEAKLPFAHTIQHVQNHRTHHRGQITAALTNLGYECPELDYVYFLQETKSK